MFVYVRREVYNLQDQYLNLTLGQSSLLSVVSTAFETIIKLVGVVPKLLLLDRQTNTQAEDLATI